MVDSVSGLNRAISALRMRLAANRSATATGVQRAAPRSPPERREQASGPETAHVANLAVRLAAITGSEPDRSRRRLRAFLEAVLLDEFGSRHALSPEFQDLVERVAHAVETEEAMAQTVRAALAELDDGSGA